MTISSSEAEKVAILQYVVMVVIQLIRSMNISVKLPVMVRADNVETIFIARKINTTSHTKHMEIRYKYLHEYVEDGIAKIIFYEVQ